MRFRASLIFSTAVIVALALPPEIASADDTTADAEQAARLELNAAGLALVAGEIRRSALGDVTNQPLDAIDENIGGGVQMKSDSLSYSISFGDVQLVPAAGYLRLVVGIRSARVHADKIKFEKNIGTTVRTTCTDTDVIIGERGSVVLSMAIVPRVSGERRFELSPGDVDFGIPDSEYRVSGPARCSGALGVGSLIRFAVRSALERGREKIAERVRTGVSDRLPSVATAIDTELHQELPLELQLVSALPVTRLVVRTSPYSVSVGEQGLDFVMSARFDPAAFESILPIERMPKHLIEDSHARPVFGSVGLNPALINELLDAIRPRQAEIVELTDALIPGLNQVANRSALAAIWPDLTDLALTSERLRLFASFPSSPRLEITSRDGRDELHLVIPELVLTFYVSRSGAWHRYFHLRVGMRAPVELLSADGILSVAVGEGARLMIGGEWDAGYTPVIDLFEEDVAYSVFASLLDALVAQGSLTQIAVPSITLGGVALTLDRPRIAAPWFKVDVVGGEQ